MFIAISKFIGILIILSIIVVFCSFAVGHLQPSPNILSLLDELVCKMHTCKIQIAEPDENIIGFVESIEHDLSIWTYWHSVTSTINVTIYNKSDVDFMYLGDLLFRYNKPCFVIITEDAINVQYPNFYAIINSNYKINDPNTLGFRISPYMVIDTLVVNRNPPSCNAPLLFPTSHNIISNWQGFKTLGFYIENKLR